MIETPSTADPPLSRKRQVTPLCEASCPKIAVPFDLRDDRAVLDKSETLEMLEQIFPSTIGVGHDGFFLYILVSEMPPKPWLKTIAGLPLYLGPRLGPEYCPMPQGWSVH
ncbi:hypothetical protein EDB80DRAFT_890308 [Ilyonectria destructans]|nr:hypothetical protein EDB80DRAFT_890308 [Ilyonectria destructans]